MKHEIIHTSDYLLVVDDAKNHPIDGKHRWFFVDGDIQRTTSIQPCDGVNLILAHLPLNNAPFLEGAPFLPPLEQEDDVVSIEGVKDLSSFVRGYNKAKERYKYTQEDIDKALTYGWDLSHYHRFNTEEKLLKMQRDFIRSLSQPKMVIAFECEVVVLRERPTDIRNHIYDKTYEVPKTTTNNLGQTQWVGRYIYA